MSVVFDLNRPQEMAGFKPLEPDFNPQDMVGAFDGTGAALRDNLYKTALKAEAIGGLALSTVAKPLDAISGDTSASDAIMGALVDPAFTQMQRLDRAAELRGMGAEILGQVVGFIPELATTPIGVAGIEGVTRAGQELKKGRDLPTASSLGLVQGVAMGVGAAIPAALGETLLAKGLYGAGSNIALGAAQRGAEGAILPGEKTVSAFDPTSVIADGLIGLFAAGVAHLTLKGAGEAAPDTAPVPGTLLDAAMTDTHARSIDTLGPEGADLARHAEAGRNLIETVQDRPDIPVEQLDLIKSEASKINDMAGVPQGTQPDLGPIVQQESGTLYPAGKVEQAPETFTDNTAVPAEIVKDKEFMQWFGKSRVADEFGLPIFAYKGMEQPMEGEGFRVSGETGKGKGTGAFFTSAPAVANSYLGGTGSNVHRVYLSLQHPMIIDAAGSNWRDIKKDAKVELPAVKVADEDEALLAELEGRAPNAGATVERKARTTTFGELFNTLKAVSTDDLARWARKQGYDGLIIRNVIDRGPSVKYGKPGANKPADTYVTFREDQARPAIGLAKESYWNPVDADGNAIGVSLQAINEIASKLERSGVMIDGKKPSEILAEMQKSPKSDEYLDGVTACILSNV